MANEKRLIDANALKRFTCETCNAIYGDEPCKPCDCRGMAVIDEQPTVDAVHVEELERILSTTPGLELWDYQKRGIMSAVKRLCGKEKNDG